MKKSRATLMIATAATAGLVLAGCSGGGNGDGGGDGGGDDTVTVAFVPKLQGSPFFEAMNSGAEVAAEDYDNLEWLYQGPTTADAAAQADVVRSFIQQQVDVLIVAPNDPDSMAPLLQEAKDAGIRVGTADTDAPNSVREVFVNQATAEGVGSQVMDSLAEAMGEEGEYAVVSCGETAENLNSWIEAQTAHQEENYPDMELVDIGYSGEDQAANAQMATDFMNAHPDLKGLIGQCTTSAVGVAQAVRDAGKIGEVFTVGVGTPASMVPYLEDGSSSASILWDVEELGYLTAWAGLQLGLGEDFQATNEVSDTLPEVEYIADEKTLILGPAMEFNAENAAGYDY
ncbi:autoinducer 2 ABC transporter substrate-binding protein [Leucobacter sp. CSA1]|uniref:Autoinducer 2 ABC transporter substrate-binding protein n=1 Tax=Leucobacter chromiisoli TaxID=2796471 RepID=A0A934Q887_9MICO|nr:autoinducer 2 ABC transporter substrate-binding protein [Leucobacter chromiisoli]MBK0418357.1 autoinducer 2 ABC transporter substrate-binding protein [Leucobacter chromiisoli]